MTTADIYSILIFVLFMTPAILAGVAYLMREKISFSIRKVSKTINKKKVFLTLAATGFLFYALSDDLDAGFFTLLRIVVFAVSIYLAHLAYVKNEKSLWVWLFGFIVVLFNPVLPIHLERNTWILIDLITGLFLLFSLFLFKTKPSDTEMG